MTDETISAEAVLDEKQRMEFLPKYAGKNYLRFETCVYALMDRASRQCQGGFWTFFELSNGGFYMCPDQSQEFLMTWEGNYFEGKMSADSAGVAVTLMALGHFSCTLEGEDFAEHFHRLRDFALQCAESALIFGFID